MAYDDIINAAAKQYRVDSNLIKAIIRVESNWDPNAIRHEPQINDTSYGLMQILLNTGKMVSGNPSLTVAQLKDPTTNILLGTKYLRSHLDRYPFDAAIAAYNAGKPYYSKLIPGTFTNQGYVNKVKNALVYYQRPWIGLVGLVGLGVFGLVMLKASR